VPKIRQKGISHLSTRKRNTNEIKQLENGKGLLKKPPKGHRCGMEGHWSRNCRTLKYLPNLYQASIKERKINFTDSEDFIGCFDTLKKISYSLS
jgi:hypothetical protein